MLFSNYFHYILAIITGMNRVTQKGYDLRDDCTEFILSVFLSDSVTFLSALNYCMSN